MKLRISEAMDCFYDNDVPIQAMPVVDPARVQALTMEKLGLVTPVRSRRPARKLGRVLLLAATVVLALSAAALAVYQYSIRDAFLEPLPAESPTVEMDAGTEPQNRKLDISLNGYADSPEYQAYLEWTDWREQWDEENPDWFREHGVDDSYFETPENYARLYDAYAAEHGEKLEEIMAKYSLTPHEERLFLSTARQYCAALEMEDIIFGRDVRGDYIYDDGSFKLVDQRDIGGEDVWITYFNAVKGSFSMIYWRFDPNSEQWGYETKDGFEAAMAVSDTASLAIVQLEGSYLTLSILTPMEKQQLEALVEEVNLTGLNERFATAEARASAAEAVAAYGAVLEAGGTTPELSDEAEMALDILGNYSLAALPENQRIYSTGGGVGNDGVFSVVHRSQGQGSGVEFFYSTLAEGQTKPDIPMFSDEINTPVTVNGYAGTLQAHNQGEDHCVSWLDTDRELVFTINGYGFTADEVLALAESVTAEDPEKDAAGPEGRRQRIAEYQLELAAIAEAEQLELEARMAEMHAVWELLGDPTITALPEGVEARVCEEMVTDPDLKYSDHNNQWRYHYNMKFYDGEGSSCIILFYARYWTDKTKTDCVNDEEYAYRAALSRPENHRRVDCTVNGNAAHIITINGESIIRWMDPELELYFEIQPMGTQYSDAELIAMAESVQ